MTFGAILEDTQIQPLGVARFADRPTGGEVFSQAMESNTGLLGLKLSGRYRSALEERSRKIKEVTGEELGDTPFFGTMYDALVDLGESPTGGFSNPFEFANNITKKINAVSNRNELIGSQEKKLKELKEKYPELEDIETFESIDERIRTEEGRIQQDFETVIGARPGIGTQGLVLAAGLTSGVTDPVNLGLTVATLPLSGPIKGASLLANVLKVASREAAINAGVEIAQQPLVSVNTRTLGMDFTTQDAVANVLFAAGGGAILSGTFAGIAGGIGKIRQKAQMERINNIETELTKQVRQLDDALAAVEREYLIAASSPFIEPNANSVLPRLSNNKFKGGTSLSSADRQLRYSVLHTQAINNAMETFAQGNTVTMDTLPFSSDLDMLSKVSGYDTAIARVLNEKTSQAVIDAVEEINFVTGQRLRNIDDALKNEQLSRGKKEALFEERERLLNELDENAGPELAENIKSFKKQRELESKALAKEKEKLSRVIGDQRINESANPFRDFDINPRKPSRKISTKIAYDTEPIPQSLIDRGFEEVTMNGNEMLNIYRNLNQPEKIQAEVDAFLNELDDNMQLELDDGTITTGKEIKQMSKDNANITKAVQGCAI